MSDDTGIPTVRSFATSHLIPCHTLNPLPLYGSGAIGSAVLELTELERRRDP